MPVHNEDIPAVFDEIADRYDDIGLETGTQDGSRKLPAQYGKLFP